MLGRDTRTSRCWQSCALGACGVHGARLHKAGMKLQDTVEK